MTPADIIHAVACVAAMGFILVGVNGAEGATHREETIAIWLLTIFFAVAVLAGLASLGMWMAGA